MNAFMKFSQVHRQKVRDENPKMSMPEVAKVLGAMWRDLSDKKKEQYKDKDKKSKKS